MKGKALKRLSRTLRRNQTDAEKKLWKYLRSRQFEGVKFRRQQPFGPYIADFCSLEKALVIELDGSQHAEQQGKDAERTKFFEKEGFRVIRIWDNEVFENLEGVLEYIRQFLKKHPHPNPLPSREREEE